MNTATMTGLDYAGIQSWPINDGCEKETQDVLEDTSWSKEKGIISRKGEEN